MNIKTVPLGHVISDLFTGYQFRKKLESQPKGDALVVQMRDINEFNEIDYKGLPKFSSEGVDDKFFVCPGDILFINRGFHNYATLIQETPGKLIAGGNLFILRVNTKLVFPGYVVAFLNQSYGQKILQQYRVGGGTPMIRKKSLRNIPFKLHRLDTQEKIAALYQLKVKEQKLLSEIQTQRDLWMNSILSKAIEGQIRFSEEQ